MPRLIPSEHRLEWLRLATHLLMLPALAYVAVRIMAGAAGHPLPRTGAGLMGVGLLTGAVAGSLTSWRTRRGIWVLAAALALALAVFGVLIVRATYRFTPPAAAATPATTVQTAELAMAAGLWGWGLYLTIALAVANRRLTSQRGRRG